VVLGAAYRGGVKETAFSGVFPTVQALHDRGANVFVHDPMYTNSELVDLGFAPFQFGDEADAAIIQADHSEYRTLSEIQIKGVRTVLDGRNLGVKMATATVLPLGTHYE
jgi:UDP-N-acetyl-D-mannosaminuronate dehydrogenase